MDTLETYQTTTGSSAVPSCTSGGEVSSAVGVDVVKGEDDAVDRGRRMAWRWASYQALVSSSIAVSLLLIRNARSVFLFFAAEVV
jgi:hypothetical protein